MAFVMAIVLARKQNKAAKVNGWIVIGLNIVPLIIGLIALIPSLFSH